MNIYRISVLSLFSIFFLVSCNQDDSCSTNANLNGDCFNLDATLDIQTINTTPSYTRENLSIIFQFPPEGPQERVRLTIRSDDEPQSSSQSDEVLFLEGKTYTDTGSCTFNGDLSAGGIPCQYTYTFSKVDRENNLISGEIEFSYSNDFGSDEFEGSFENVEIKGEDF